MLSRGTGWHCLSLRSTRCCRCSRTTPVRTKADAFVGMERNEFDFSRGRTSFARTPKLRTLGHRLARDPSHPRARPSAEKITRKCTSGVCANSAASSCAYWSSSRSILRRPSRRRPQRLPCCLRCSPSWRPPHKLRSCCLFSRSGYWGGRTCRAGSYRTRRTSWGMDC
jgi:hypothetical protein